MSYQTCPLCKGSGFDPTIMQKENCPICDGKRLISDITGFPPQHEEYFSTDLKKLIPIYKECDVDNCDCDGSCTEIIGYEDL